MDIKILRFRDFLGPLSIFLLFDIMMILNQAQPQYLAIMKTNQSEYVQLVANSPAIFILLNKANLSNNATFGCEKLNLYQKLCMDKLFRPLLVVLVEAFAYLRKLAVVVTVTIVRQLFPKFVIYD